MDELLTTDASSCHDPDSPLSTMNKIMREGYSLLCSQDCPCSGNPLLFRNDDRVQVVDTEDPNGIKNCTDTPTKRCLYFGYAQNNYNA